MKHVPRTQHQITKLVGLQETSYLNTPGNLLMPQQDVVLPPKMPEGDDHLGYFGSTQASIKRVKGKIANLELEDMLLREELRKAERAAARSLIDKWLEGPLILQKPPSSVMDQFIRNFSCLELLDDGQEVPCASPEIHSVRVEHDWAALVSKSPDFMDGAWRLPYNATCFEFMISDVRVCVLTTDTESGGDKIAHVGLRLPKRDGGKWVVDPAIYVLGANGWRGKREYCKPNWARCMTMLYQQVKACCIVLDAEVVTAEPERAPFRTNQPPKDDKAPLPKMSFHVVSLSRRHSRASALPLGKETTADRRSPRCHFRRGHWRHYAEHKTWIKWMVVGDPDLGMIEKEYRL